MLPVLTLAQSVATVIDTRPRLVTVQELECHIERVTVPRAPGGIMDGTAQALKGDGDALAGAIIGGVIGNRIGGENKGAAATLGVIIGSNIASDTAGRGNAVEYQDREVCRPVTRQIQRGEIVTFEYQGRRFTVTFD